MLELIVTLALLAACWYGYKTWIIRSAGPKAVIRRHIPENVYEWPEHEDEFDIVGESYYQSAIRGLAGLNDEHVRNKEYRAFLIPENDNPHDDKAIRIDIEGTTVGYLSREDARSFRRRLSAKKLTGQITACKSYVIGGQSREGNEWNYGICLSIKNFGW
ncbi:MAG: HIRAN domain-containing protein [Nitrosospira sp.]